MFILIGKIETLVLLFEREREKMGDKNDGLGLSLSLGYATQRNHHQQPSLKLNLMPLDSQNKHKKKLPGLTSFNHQVPVLFLLVFGL